MNLTQLAKNISHHFRLHPVAVRLDELDNELPHLDYDWVLRVATKEGIRIENIATGHTVMLGTDHVHHYTSDVDRKGPAPGYGFLTLTVQLFLKGNQVLVRPTLRPGERTSLDGLTPEGRAARARLLDERLELVMHDYQGRGTPAHILRTFSDLTDAEKADLYDRAVMRKKGRPSKSNPFRS